jgi:hypothetical protein
MDWKDNVVPNAPGNLRFESMAQTGPAVIQWDIPELAADGDSAARYVLYRLADYPSGNVLDQPENILDVTGLNYYDNIPASDSDTPFYYVVTALDRNNNESTSSNLISIEKPLTPALAMPLNGALNQRDTLFLNWYWSENTTSFGVQLAGNINMNNPIINDDGIQDTMKMVTGLTGLKEYFWRIRSQNPAGSSEFSETFSFTTGFPPVTTLISPEDGTSDVPLDTILTWSETDSADMYYVQLNQTQTFLDEYMVLDTVVLNDNSMVVEDLDYFSRRWYYWRVKAANDLGSSDWSETWMFRTIPATFIADHEYAPVTYGLRQNYPNPFNPTTTIEYSLADPGFVSLKVYDLLGKEVQTLVNQEQPGGHYSVTFDASDLAAGVYMYRLVTNSTVLHKKMVLVK